MYTTNIIVNLTVEGVHCWQDIPDELKRVGYLKFVHRHNFTIKAKKRVNHDNRDLEIILYKRKIDHYLKGKYYDTFTGCLVFNSMSCEMIAKELVQVFGLEYCEVLEDGENGAEVIREDIDWPEMVFVCGYPCSGKKTFIEAHLSDHRQIVVSDIVKELKESETTSELNDTKDLDQDIAEKIHELCSRAEVGDKIVIDGIRQLSILKQLIGNSGFQIVWLDVPYEVREDRFNKRQRSSDDISYAEICSMNDELGLEELHEELMTHLKDKTLVIEN